MLARQELGDMSKEEWSNGEMDDNDQEAPAMVTAIPASLRADVTTLAEIFTQTSVPVVSVRCRKVLTMIHGFGDAPGTGLGSTYTCGSGFNFLIGVWGAEDDEESLPMWSRRWKKKVQRET